MPRCRALRAGARSVELTTRYFLSVPALLNASLDTVTILDARSGLRYHRGHLPGAVQVNWRAYRDGWGRTGKLMPDTFRLARHMAALGVDQRRPVVVYGAARDGWGEEGRVAWMLRYLGHPNVTILDGGYGAWIAANGTTTRDSATVAPGTLAVNVMPSLRADADAVARAVVDAPWRGTTVLDTRSTGEWNGSWRYFPTRTGRIPGAIHLTWSTLLTPDGHLDRSEAAMARLRAAGLDDPEQRVIAYCVGGVRSAFAALALRELGFRDVRNYDGSWYEWSADRTRPIEQPAERAGQRSGRDSTRSVG